MRWLMLALALFSGCQRDREQARLPSPPPGAVGYGTDVGSAGENPPEEHMAAWFVGNQRPIRACLEVAPDFGVDKTKARMTLARAFRMWATYLGDRDLPLTRSFAIEDDCDPTIDVTFYFGVENERVKEARRQFLNPTAFVQRTHFDRTIPRGRGFIWIAKQAVLRADRPFPDWTRAGRLLAILLHEIGHLHGNDHVPGTVMAANISELLDSNWSGTWLAEIDYCRELAPCRGCVYPTTGGTKVRMDQSGLFDYGVFLKRDFIGQRTRVFKVVHERRISSRFNFSFIQYDRVWGDRVALEYNLASCEPWQKNDKTVLQLKVIGP